MSSPKFAETHNVVAFLEKPIESDGFAEIIVSLKASSSSLCYNRSIQHYLHNLIFKVLGNNNVKMVNRVRQLQDLINKKKISQSQALEVIFTWKMQKLQKKVGEIQTVTTDSNQNIPLLINHLTLLNQAEKQKAQEKQRKEAEVAHDETEHEENHAIEECLSKKRVDKLEKRRKFRTTWLKRLKNVGAAKRVESSNDSLGAQEDASKQGRRIEDIDVDAEVTLVNETQERQDEDLMFDIGVLDGDEMFVDATTARKLKQSTKLDDKTLAQTLMEIKAAKPKAKGKCFLSENQVSKPNSFCTDDPKSRLCGKGIMQEPERPLTKKDQVALDEDLADISWLKITGLRDYNKRRDGVGTDEEKGQIVMETYGEKMKTHFATLRHYVKRNKEPPTKAQDKIKVQLLQRNHRKEPKTRQKRSRDGKSTQVKLDGKPVMDGLRWTSSH
ncbi:hypothetical protein Tco_0303945 [Tanacetum coccineum]